MEVGREPGARAILFVVGVSGVGKTSALRTLAEVPEWSERCHFFDEAGVPSPEDMVKSFGSGEEWQRQTTRDWVYRLSRLGVPVTVLEGQTRPSFILDAIRSFPELIARIVLLECDPESRQRRLASRRGQPEPPDPRMEAWAAYLRGQADALGLRVIDTSGRPVEAVAVQLRREAKSLEVALAADPGGETR